MKTLNTMTTKEIVALNNALRKVAPQMKALTEKSFPSKAGFVKHLRTVELTPKQVAAFADVTPFTVRQKLRAFRAEGGNTGTEKWKHYGVNVEIVAELFAKKAS